MVRNQKGQFVPGVSGNPKGRKKRSEEEIYLDIFRRVVTPAEFEIIVRRALALAQKGDAVARKWLADYLVGPPIERKEITGADGNNIVLTVIYDK